MPLTNAGAVKFAEALVALVSTFHIGVGDSSAVFAATQTDLQASTNKLRKAMDSGYPTRVSGTLTFRATFTTSEANFAWNEWSIDSAASGGTMIGRKPEALGTKTSAQQWQHTATVTVQAAP
jgi:hypothetical protein